MENTTTNGETLTTAVPDAFLNAYIEAALWSSTYELEEDGESFPLDDGEHELAPETKDFMLKDCAEFLAYCEEIELDPFPEGESMERSGHDFWLTRNGHGAGYWDRGLETGDKLSDAAKTFGSCGLYVGDDGMIYAS